MMTIFGNGYIDMMYHHMINMAASYDMTYVNSSVSIADSLIKMMISLNAKTLSSWKDSVPKIPDFDILEDIWFIFMEASHPMYKWQIIFSMLQEMFLECHQCDLYSYVGSNETRIAKLFCELWGLRYSTMMTILRDRIYVYQTEISQLYAIGDHINLGLVMDHKSVQLLVKYNMKKDLDTVLSHINNIKSLLLIEHDNIDCDNHTEDYFESILHEISQDRKVRYDQIEHLILYGHKMDIEECMDASIYDKIIFDNDFYQELFILAAILEYNDIIKILLKYNKVNRIIRNTLLILIPSIETVPEKYMIQACCRSDIIILTLVSVWHPRDLNYDDVRALKYFNTAFSDPRYSSMLASKRVIFHQAGLLK